EERLGIPRVNLSATQATPVVEPTTAGETETVTVEAELGKPLGEDIVLNITVVDETSTATLGTDFTYAHRVYELNEATGEQSAPEGDATACPTDPMMACEVMIPAGVTRFDIEANIAMNMEREVREFIDFQIEVPEEHAGLLRGSVVERVTIEAHGNTVQFASAESTLSEDGDTPEGRVEVSVNVDLPSPVDIVLNITPTGSATEGTDYENLPDSLTIPAGQTSGTIMLRGIDNEEGDGNRLIELTLSGDLPDGWAFGSQTTHTVTLQDDDLSIFIADATPKSVAEPDNGTTTVTVTLGVTQLPPTEITVVVEAAGAGNNGQTAAEGDDYTFTAVEVPFGGSSTDLTKTTTFAVSADDEAELDETIVLRLRDDRTNSRAGTGFSLGDPYTITIPANDNTVSFASDAPTTLDETDETTGIDVAVNVNRPAPRDITLNIDTTSGTATAGTHFNISPATLTISAGEMSGTITLTGINNTDTGAPQIILTIPQSQSLPDGWTLGTATHTVNLVDDEVRTVSLNYSGATSVNAGGLGFLARMSIELSAPLEVDLMLNLVLGGTANSYLTFWSIDYNVLSAGTTQAPDVFGSGTRCQSSPCSILIEDGESFVDINFLFFGSPPSGTTAMATVELPTGHPSGVEIGSSNSVTLTTQ
ncbi:MAG: hypothetical protein OXF19_06285, partial [Hyphomicrobiales bacterium]|nr:hypothetical protein [Hyphomicrobiales bacterium]